MTLDSTGLRTSTISLVFTSIWSTCTILVVLFSALLYFHGFRGNLPYHLDQDEPVLYIAATEIRATGFPHIKSYYPPLRLYEMAIEQIVVDLFSSGNAKSVVYLVFHRAGTAYFALLVLAIMYQIGRRLHSSLAGFVTVVLLAFDSQMVKFSHLARGDTLAWLLSAGLMLGTLQLLQKRKPKAWAWVALCSAGAVLAKYSAAPLLLLPLSVIWLTTFHRPLIRWGILTAAILVNIVTFLGLRFYLQTFADAVLLRALRDLSLGFLFLNEIPFTEHFVSNWRNAQMGAGVLWLVVAFGLLPIVVAFFRSHFSPSRTALLRVLGLVLLGTAVLLLIAPIRYWDIYHMVMIGALFGGLGSAILIEKIGWSGLILVSGLTVIVSLPKAIQAWEFGRDYTQPHTLAALGDWFIENVPEGARTVVETATPFNSYAGFPGRSIYHQFTVDSIFTESVDAYRQRGYEYLIWNSIEGNDASSALDSIGSRVVGASEVLQLPQGYYQGPNILVFRILPTQQHVRYLWFGDSISFRGYDLNAETFKPGEQLTLMLYWMSAQKVSPNYIVFAHLISTATQQLAAGQDGPPDYGNTPTWAWQGDMQSVRDQRVLTIPAEAEPGKYILRIGMYDADTKARLPIFDLQDQPVGDAVTLQEIQIQN